MSMLFFVYLSWAWAIINYPSVYALSKSDLRRVRADFIMRELQVTPRREVLSVWEVKGGQNRICINTEHASGAQHDGANNINIDRKCPIFLRRKKLRQ